MRYVKMPKVLTFTKTYRQDVLKSLHKFKQNDNVITP